MNPEWIPTIVVGVAAVCASGYTVVRVLRHRRRPSNGMWALASVALFWLTAALYIVGSPTDVSGWIAYPVAAPVLAAPVVLLFTAVALAANTVVVVRREGRRLATLVPLVIACAFLVMLGAGTWWILDLVGGMGHSWFERFLFLALPLLLIPGAVFLFELIAYTGYALAYSRLDRIDAGDVVVVLGAGLNGDKVTPLLASRLDRGIEALNASVDAGKDAVIVVSGGRGVDEVVSEAEAMHAYLLDRGVDADRILVEDKSTTTAENLEFTVDLLRSHRPAWRRMVVVTSNFHVLRAASITDEMGLEATAVGSRTAPYYLPTAFLREYAATVVHFRRGTLVTIVAVIVLWLLFALATGLFLPWGA
ncbi:MAG TPA: YdcF family protein [Candidatus Dietzia intestinigallinarum]|nr:YdcF family protein [Candidatus Dietzia intestinigallinarum]